MKDRELTCCCRRTRRGLEAAMLAYAPLVKAVLPHPAADPCDREERMADVFVSLWRNAANWITTNTAAARGSAVAARNRAIDRYNAPAPPASR